jgi:hypothetical protein
MVKETWSIDKEKAEKAKKRQIQAERLRLFNFLKTTPPFKITRIVTDFHPVTRLPRDIVTMGNGDTYQGERSEVEKLISIKMTEKVDELLGLVQV